MTMVVVVVAMENYNGCWQQREKRLQPLNAMMQTLVQEFIGECIVQGLLCQSYPLLVKKLSQHDAW